MTITLYYVRIDGRRCWYTSASGAKRCRDDATKRGQFVVGPVQERMPLDREALVRWLNEMTRQG